jgi:hypothetical protein
VVITSGTNDGEIRQVTNYVSSTGEVEVRTAFTAQVANSVTFELWDQVYPPARIHDIMNQSIIEATGRVYDPEEDVSLHGDGSQARFDLPSEFAMLQRVEYRSSVYGTRLHACAEVFDESVDDHISVKLDTKDKKQGAQSCQFTFNSSTVEGEKATDSITSKDISAYDYIEFWIKSTVLTSAGNLQLHLDDHTNCQSPIETVNIQALSADTWTFVRATLSNPELNTAIISVGLDMDVDVAPCVVWLDDISVVRNETALWRRLPKHLWSVDKEARDLILTPEGRGLVGASLIKLVGGDDPALFTAESSPTELDDFYVIARTTGLALASASGGPATDPDSKRTHAGYWFGMAASRMRSWPPLKDIRRVE